jgi:hypothetical protein
MTNRTAIPHERAESAKAGLYAWCRVLEALAEQREALEYRQCYEGIDDKFLAADIQTWCELAWALADFLAARRAAR